MVRALIVLSLVFIAVLSGLINFKYLKGTNLKFLVYFLIYVLFSEAIGTIMLYNNTNTNLFNNVYSIASTLFFILFFRAYIINKIYRKISIFFVLFFSLCVLLNSIFNQHFLYSLQTNTYILGFLLIVITVILFFIDILNSDKILKLNKLPVFWISIGVFIFNISIMPVMVIAKFIKWAGVYNYILLVVNVIMYCCFAYSFYLREKNRANS